MPPVFRQQSPLPHLLKSPTKNIASKNSRISHQNFERQHDQTTSITRRILHPTNLSQKKFAYKSEVTCSQIRSDSQEETNLLLTTHKKLTTSKSAPPTTITIATTTMNQPSTTNTMPKPTQKSLPKLASLLGLPRELRNMIYTNLIETPASILPLSDPKRQEHANLYPRAALPAPVLTWTQQALLAQTHPHAHTHDEISPPPSPSLSPKQPFRPWRDALPWSVHPQLDVEMEEFIESRERMDGGKLVYRLDAVPDFWGRPYVSWVSVPRVEDDIDVLDVNVRLFWDDYREGTGERVFESRDVRLDGDMTETIVNRLFGLVERFFWYGPDFLGPKKKIGDLGGVGELVFRFESPREGEEFRSYFWTDQLGHEGYLKPQRVMSEILRKLREVQVEDRDFPVLWEVLVKQVERIRILLDGKEVWAMDCGRWARNTIHNHR